MTSLLPSSAQAQPAVTDEPASPLLTIDVSEHGTPAVVTASGEVDLATVGQLSSVLADTIQAGAAELLVDLERVSYLDSTGLGALVGAHKRLAASGGRLVVRCTQPRLLRLFAITGLLHVLTFDGAPDSR